jgi:hypothetical protein
MHGHGAPPSPTIKQFLLEAVLSYDNLRSSIQRTTTAAKNGTVWTEERAKAMIAVKPGTTSTP